jgi:hypothetical protein
MLVGSGRTAAERSERGSAGASGSRDFVGTKPVETRFAHFQKRRKEQVSHQRPVLKNIKLRPSSKFERSLGRTALENVLKSCANKLA